MGIYQSKHYTIAKADVTAPRNTMQKEVVRDIVLNACDHPTAETIYNCAKEQIPNISLGTVYRILKSLVASGDVREINIPNAPSAFDKTVKNHAHFACSVCGKVFDVPFDGIENAIGNVDFKFDSVDVIFKGVCPDCENKAK